MKASIIWRRLDISGHDACTLYERRGGFELDGCALFVHEGAPARLNYKLVCDGSWRTLRGRVDGVVGGRVMDIVIERSAEGVWTRNGAIVSGLNGCVDLDLGFSPASNLCQLRRLNLADGNAADAPVAWLDVSSNTLSVLAQRYERRAKLTYWYEAPRFDYAALLEVNEVGFVLRYPGLWEAEAVFA